MFPLKTLLFISYGINYLSHGAAQSVVSNSSLYIPGVPSVGGLESGEVVVAELMGTDGETSTFALLDSVPTIVSGITTRTTATFTLVSAPTVILLTADVDRDFGPNDVEEKIHTECFIDGSGESLCRDLMVDIVDHEKTVTITSLFSETTSGVPVVAIGFGATTSPSKTSITSSPSSTITSAINTTSLTPMPPAPSMSSDDVVTVTLTSPSPVNDSPFANSGSGILTRPLLYATSFIALVTAFCFL